MAGLEQAIASSGAPPGAAPKLGLASREIQPFFFFFFFASQEQRRRLGEGEVRKGATRLAVRHPRRKSRWRRWETRDGVGRRRAMPSPFFHV